MIEMNLELASESFSTILEMNLELASESFSEQVLWAARNGLGYNVEE